MTGSPDLVLLPTDVEDDLRASVRGVLARLCTTDALDGLYDGRAPELPGAAWRALSDELGLAGLLVPESLGGAGASAREAAVVMEEVGRACAPVPFLTSAVVATTLLLELGERADVGATPSSEVATLLGRLAAGEATAALVLPATATTAARAPGLRGSVRSVVGLPADVLLVPVVEGDRVALHAVLPSDAGVTVTAVVSLDMTRPLADVTLADPGSTLLSADAGAAIETALRVGAGLLAAEQVGVATWCLETTVAYLKDRRQFGRVVGGFQALKHRLADLFAEVESARAAATYAAAALAEDHPDGPVAVAVAQSFCADVALHAAEEAVQLHGGLGMTWEHPAHLHLKRAKADQLLLGSPEQHRVHLAALVDLPAS